MNSAASRSDLFAIFHVEDSPVLATAIHDGHAMRSELRRWLALEDAVQLREEDPHTGAWALLFPSHVISMRSRFEVDLNRPREKAVYRTPEDAWGLDVWRDDFPDDEAARSLELYDRFYAELRSVLDRLVARHGRVAVIDLHSYNHRRDGSERGVADPIGNPELNIGTGTMDRDRWGRVVDRFISDLSNFELAGRRFDVRENVRFQGGELPRWIHETYPETVVALAVEAKKFFMDEWTGELNHFEFLAVGEALKSTLPGLLETLGGPAREQAA